MSTIHTIVKPKSNKSVVFIHGVNGSWHDTWQRKGLKSWPEHVSDGKLWGIHSIDFDVHTNWSQTTMPLQDRAINLLNLLAGHDTLRSDDLIIIAHSFGGIVAKQMVRAAHDYATNYASFLDRLIGIVFVSTPHTGAGIATFLDYLKRLLGSTVTIENLRSHEPYLRDLDTWYRNNHDILGLRSQVFYETQKLKIGWLRTIQVVNPSSADPGLTGVIPVAVDADHTSICKPRTYKDLQVACSRQFIEDAFSLPSQLAKLPKQAGAVCYRKRDGVLEFLLVKTSGRLWTFPKGHIDPGKTTSQAAEEEAFQEGGVRGQVDQKPLTTYLHAKQELKKDVAARFAITAHLLAVKEDGVRCENHRCPTWFEPAAAKQALSEGRDLVYRKEFERVVDEAVKKLQEGT